MSKARYLLILVVFLGGCASLRFASIEDDIISGTFKGVYLPVPFVKQKSYWCGPAALSSVLAYWGKDIPQEEIAEAIYRPSIRATLTIELEEYPSRLNLFASAEGADFSELKARLRSGFPVIVLCKNPFPILGRFHYLVVTGFDEPRGVVISHTGRRPDIPIPYRDFRRRWEGANRWMLVISPPRRVDWSLMPEEKIRLAILLEKEGDLEKAEAIYNGLINEMPHSAIVLFNLGNIYLKRGVLTSAEEYYKRSIASDSQLADAYNNLAWVYVRLGNNLKEAEELIQKALNLSKKNYALYMDTLGEVYRKRGMYEEAVSSFKDALVRCNNQKEKAEVYIHLGRAYEEIGEESQAGECYHKAEELANELK